MDKRWKRDEHGQWWWYPPSGNRRRGDEVACERCGELFPSLAISRKRGHGIYCSRSCANKGYRSQRHRRGEDNPNWRGGRHLRKRDGYVQVSVSPPDGGKRVWMLEHRHVMAQKLGRDLYDYETVHHRNGDKADNRLENLELHVGRHGRGATESHCPTCTCFAHQP